MWRRRGCISQDVYNRRDTALFEAQQRKADIGNYEKKKNNCSEKKKLYLFHPTAGKQSTSNSRVHSDVVVSLRFHVFLQVRKVP